MPIPKPGESESEKDYVSRVIEMLVKEGKAADQAAAIAKEMWAKNSCKRRKIEDRHLFNRAYKPDPQGWSHIVPFGEYYNAEAGCTQVFDKDALLSMIDAFRRDASNANFPGLLVDFDHGSLNLDRPTEAAGWIEVPQGGAPEDAMEVRDDGLWARIRLTDVGSDAVRNGRYRLISPVFNLRECAVLEQPAANGSERLRPMRLDRVALTNDPNLKPWKLAPLSNRDGDKAGHEAGADAEQQKQKQPQKGRALMNRALLLTLLGLAADATDEQVNAALPTLQNRLADLSKAQADLAKAQSDLSSATARVEELTNRVKTLDEQAKAHLAEDVDRDLAEFESVISPESKDAIKAQLLANRTGTRAILAGMKKPAKKSEDHVYNREAAGRKGPADSQVNPAEESSAKRIRARANEIIAANRSISWQTAWNQAQRELSASK